MNPKIMIYIILSTILLYLYYRKRDLSILMAFIVLVSSTLIFGKDVREGATSGSGGGDKECGKMGFKPPKIDKSDMNGSLEKVMKNAKPVLDKYISYDVKDPQKTQLKEEYKEAIEFISKLDIVKSEMKKVNESKENGEYMMNFGFATYFLVNSYILTDSEETRKSFVDKDLEKLNKKNDKGVVPLTMILKGGNLGLEILTKIKKSDEMKDADKTSKELINTAYCSIKQCLFIWKAIEKAKGGDGNDDKKDDDDDKAEDEDDDKKKKKKKSGNKNDKKKKSDEDAGDDE